MNSLLFRSCRIISLDRVLGVGGGVNGDGDKGSGDGFVVDVSKRFPSFLGRVDGSDILSLVVFLYDL